MNYNLYFSTKTGKFNILNLTEDKLIKVIKAYLEGLDSVTITGDKYILKAVYEFKIFTFEPNGDPIEAIRYLLSNINFHKKTSDGKYLPTTTLATIGKDVTNNFIGDKEFGEASESTKSATKNESGNFINLNRLNELRNINSPKFDLAILIKLCEELNDNYKNGNYLSVAMNCRTILNSASITYSYGICTGRY